MQYFLKFCFGFELASLTKILREKLVLVLLSLRTKISGKLKHGKDSCKIFLNLKKKKKKLRSLLLWRRKLLLWLRKIFKLNQFSNPS